MIERPETTQALGQLLGPTEPEVCCDVCYQVLDRCFELERAGPTPTSKSPACAVAG